MNKVLCLRENLNAKCNKKLKRSKIRHSQRFMGKWVFLYVYLFFLVFWKMRQTEFIFHLKCINFQLRTNFLILNRIERLNTPQKLARRFFIIK